MKKELNTTDDLVEVENGILLVQRLEYTYEDDPPTNKKVNKSKPQNTKEYKDNFYTQKVMKYLLEIRAWLLAMEGKVSEDNYVLKDAFETARWALNLADRNIETAEELYLSEI